MKRAVLSILIMLLGISSYADDAVVAKVNGTAITSRDLEAEVDTLIPRSTYHGSVSDEKRAEFREKALNDLIDRELQYQDAVARGMKPDKKQVKAQMGLIRDRFKSKKEYRKALEEAGVTEDRLREQVEKALLVQDVTAKTVTGPSAMDEAAVKDYYDKHTDKFRQPEAVRLRIISTKNEKKAAEILSRVRAGEDFGGIAARMSEDDYRIMGGDIGYMHRGRLLLEIEGPAFKLGVGETSGLIKANGIWYLIKVEEKKPEQQLTFAESKDKLKQELEAKRSSELLDAWLEGLRAKARIEITGPEAAGQEKPAEAPAASGNAR